MLKLGYKASSEQFGPRELAEYAVLAEELGFDSVVVADHFQPWRHDGGHAPFSFAWMAAVGERTKRVELGTSVVAPSYRYHPGIVAQAIATLACLYPGRVFLGVGTGEAMNETPLGVEWPDQKERFQRLKEACTLMKRLWTEDRVTFEGNYFRTENATIYDRPEGGVPLYIAAAGPAAARLAGRIGDGFITTSGKAPELYSEKLIPAVREGVEKEGRSMGDVELTIEMKVSFDTDRSRALSDTRIWAALALPAEDKVDVHNPKEMEERARNVEHPERRWLVSDDPEEHVEQLRPYIELGFTHLVFHAPGDDQSRFLHLYAMEILPRLRERFG